MYLMYYMDENGERVYTLKVRHAAGSWCWGCTGTGMSDGQVTVTLRKACSAPARAFELP